METLDHTDYHVWLNFLRPTPLCREGEKNIRIFCPLFITYADGRNRARAASAASECAIHYTIASRLLAPKYKLKV